MSEEMKIWRRSRPTALITKISLQRGLPNRMLSYPAKFFRTTLHRIRQILMYLMFTV